MNYRKIFRSLPMVSITVLTASLASPFLAQAATSLPNGASSLTETYDNWTVTCRLQAQGETKNVLCSMSQQQVDDKGQRALTVELSPTKDGTLGAFILPFGLKLASGATLQLDEAAPQKPLGFSTCLPAGCIVPINMDAAQTDALAKGKILAILTQAMDNNDIKLNVPLDGFSAAFKRTKELLK